MTVDLTLFKPWIVVLAEALRAGKYKPISSICVHSCSNELPFLPGWKMSHVGSLPECQFGPLKGRGYIGSSASLSATGMLAIWQQH